MISSIVSMPWRAREGSGNLSGPFSPEHTKKEAVIAEAFRGMCWGLSDNAFAKLHQ